MKNSNKLLLGLLAVIILAITSLVVIARINLEKGNFRPEKINAGDLTQNRSVAEFNEIDIEGKIKVSYIQDTFQRVVIKADSNLVKIVISEVKNGKLYLYTSERYDEDEPIKVEVVTDSINSIDISAGGVFETVNKMKVNHLDSDASAGAVLNIDGDIYALKFEMKAGCVANIEGKCNTLDVSISSGCVFNSGSLQAEYGNVSASSGAVMNIHVNREINVNANSGSVIKCSGKPQIKDINISSGAQFMNI